MKFKRKKSRRQRASTFHGWGRGAAHHKGSGNRGGYGRAGSGKKADGKKPSFWKEPQGRHGFGAGKSRMLGLCAINLDAIVRNLKVWETQGFAKKAAKGYEVDLPAAGFDKLLGSGMISAALFIKTDFASAGAIEKVKEAGGEVTVLKKIVKKEKKKPVAKKKEAAGKDEKGDEE